MRELAYITGATSGIGESVARALAYQGYDLIITGRRANRLNCLKQELKSEYGIEVFIQSFDVRDRRQCESFFDSLSLKHRDIDVLVNSAGVAIGTAPIHEGDPLDWDEMIDTNIKGLLYIIRRVSQIMVQRGSGHIINIGAIENPTCSNGVVYCATKQAIHALTKGMRHELAGKGVKITEIRPGLVDTEFLMVQFDGDEDMVTELCEKQEALIGDDIADSVMWVLSQPEHVNIDEIVISPSVRRKVADL